MSNPTTAPTTDPADTPRRCLVSWGHGVCVEADGPVFAHSCDRGAGPDHGVAHICRCGDVGRAGVDSLWGPDAPRAPRPSR